MVQSKIYTKEVSLSVDEVAKYIRNNAEKYGFIVRYDSDMAQEFKEHGVDVKEGFEYVTLMLCIPQKAYTSILMNPIRAALIMPKQITILKNLETGKTIISHLIIGTNFLEEILPSDLKIRESLPNSCLKVVELIESIN